MAASDNMTVRASLVPKMLLAALLLLLPLMVITALTVSERNEQIDAIDQRIHGIEYLAMSRRLLDETTAYFVASGRDVADDSFAVQHRAVSQTLDDIESHLTAEGDAFGLLPRLAHIRALWTTTNKDSEKSDLHQRHLHHHAVHDELLKLFRYVGDRSGLAAAPTIDSAYIGTLVIRRIPEAVARIGDIRIHVYGAPGAPHAAGPRRDNHSLYNEWSLTLAHTALVRDFDTAVSLNPHLAALLGNAVETFDRRAHAFHMAITEMTGGLGLYRQTFGDQPGAGAMITVDQPRDAAPNDGANARIADDGNPGGAATDAAFELFDRAAAQLTTLLVQKRTALTQTRMFAVVLVAGASIFAIMAGWRLLSALMRPLQAEIAERRRAEQKTRELASIVESSQDSILVISPEGRFKSWNRGAERLYGYRAEEAIGQPTSLLAPPGLQAETPEAVAAVLRNLSTPTLDTVRKRKDGSYINVSLRTSPVFDAEGNVNGIAVIGRDITDRKRAESELREKERALKAHVAELSQAQKELRAHRDHLEDLVRERTAEVETQAARLEEALRREKEFNVLRRKFVSMASHEFRTPLAIIDASAQRIGRRAEHADPADIRTRVDKIRNAVGRMLALIDSTLDLSRIEEGKVVLRPAPVDIAALVAEVCSRQQEISPTHIIRTDLDELPREIVADSQLLDHVFTNLLSNAVKYAPDSPEIDVRGRTTDDIATISVTDRGRGIPEAELPQMFQRYFRASTAHGISGTGIGLNLSQEFVELHGGAIEIESAVGAGTTFTVKLPRSASHQEDTTPGQAPTAITNSNDAGIAA